ncbi:hypothetical protein LEP1GSC082_1631 [Leptospira kirschneri str. H2]|uniref:Uncharacterized protein n=1 Tax=Leptospira kirschneri str. H1 TaxID=1049966 RepID=A0A0E2B9U9_9LEPT|nr:hypothetical protein LEP1GSC081_3005 [Leptospira kirschneri str. H1]EKO58671.1 hypothetical protein LEP1GSC082_1631 [Leptospira kirschneri str. H2]
MIQKSKVTFKNKIKIFKMIFRKIKKSDRSITNFDSIGPS